MLCCAPNPQSELDRLDRQTGQHSRVSRAMSSMLMLAVALAVSRGPSAFAQAPEAAPSPAEPVESPATATAAQTLAEWPTPITFQPYQIELVLSTPRTARVSDVRLAELAEQLRQRISQRIGRRWQLQLRTVSAASWAEAHTFARWTADDMAALNADQPEDVSQPQIDSRATAAPPVAEAPAAKEPASTANAAPIADTPVDTLFLLTVRRTVHGEQLVARAWEPRWDELSPPLTADVMEVRDSADRALLLLHRLFRPQGIWSTTTDPDRFQLQIQASGLADPDPSLPLLQPHHPFAPWFVFKGRGDRPDRRQPVPWTYLVPDSEPEGFGTAWMASGVRQALSAKSRGRIERRAVGVRVGHPATSVTLQARGPSPRVMALQEVRFEPWQPPKLDDAVVEDDPAQPSQQIVQIADRAGNVMLTASDRPAITWLTVSSGSLRLAKVPVVPGEWAHQILETPDDALRLHVEGQLKVVQADLVGDVALRTSILATARGAARQNRRGEVERQQQLFKRLPTAAEYLERIAGIRFSAVSKARLQQDRLAEQRVVRLCQEVEALVQRHADDEKRRLLDEEIQDLVASVQPDEGAPELSPSEPPSSPPQSSTPRSSTPESSK
jgi:hypothetical protein